MPIKVVCGYRSPQTNGMLRNRSRGVAKHSQHMLGKAMDFYFPDVSLTKVRELGFKMQVGGVGFYPTSGSPFVHMDTGSVRSWPKMSRAQLARIFPDGKTLHIPFRRQALPGYNQALAAYKARKAGGGDIVMASADTGSTRARCFFASPPPFGGGADEEEDAAESGAPCRAGRHRQPRPAGWPPQRCQARGCRGRSRRGAGGEARRRQGSGREGCSGRRGAGRDGRAATAPPPRRSPQPAAAVAEEPAIVAVAGRDRSGDGTDAAPSPARA